MQSLITELCIPSPLQQIRSKEFDRYGVELWIKRDDLIHPVLSGNKWRKMRPLVEEALHLKAHTLVGIGGAYSNLLHALAYTGHWLGVKTCGLVRGAYGQLHNPTLDDCKRWGMELKPIPRQDFVHWRQREKSGFLEEGVFFIPLGGTDRDYLNRVGEMMNEIYAVLPDVDYVTVPVGSGGTLAGMILNARPETRLLGYSTFKQDFEKEMVMEHLGKSPSSNWEIIKRYPKPGFGKIDRSLIEFLRDVKHAWGISFDAVYNGKMMWTLLEMIRSGYFSKGTKIVAIHSGGVQGTRHLDAGF